MKSILQWWVGYKLPLIHIKTNAEIRKLVADILYHPIKRRIVRLYVRLLQSFFGLEIIAITGSSGKTSIKEIVASILACEGQTVYSRDNIDPVFNIPDTIFKCGPNTKYLVLEFGVEYPNEMDFYLWLVKPYLGVITNIFPTHTLYFKDVDGVLNEKSKLVKATEVAVLNSDDKKLAQFGKNLKNKVYWFNQGNNIIESNINAATKISEILNINEKHIEQGIKNYKLPKHRLSIINHKSGAVLFDDTYNSNPEALISVLDYFDKLAGSKRKVLVLGDMLELGDIDVSEHKRVGLIIKKHNYTKVFGVGKLVRNITPDVYSLSSITQCIRTYLKPNTYILFKGSRSMHLDKLVEELL